MEVFALVWNEPEDVVEGLLTAGVFITDQLWLNRLLLSIFIKVDVSKCNWIETAFTF